MVEHGRLKDPVLHVIGFGRALGATIGDPEQLPVRVLEPEPARADAGHRVQLLPADGDDSRRRPPTSARSSSSIRRPWPSSAPTSSTASSPASSARPTPSIARRSRPLPATRRRSSTWSTSALMMGRMSSQLRQVLITATAAVPASDPSQRAIGAALSGGDLERVHRLRRRLQRRRRHPDQRPVADRSERAVDQRQRHHPALESAAASARPPTGYLLEGSLTPGRADCRVAHRQPGDARSRWRRRPGRSTCGCGRCTTAQMSLPSNEVRVYVNVAQKPSAPTNFQGGGQGLDAVAGVEEHLRRRRAERHR